MNLFDHFLTTQSGLLCNVKQRPSCEVEGIFGMSHVLVVDDSEVIRKVMGRIFEGMRCQTSQVATREEGIEICKMALPDAIVVDWNLPGTDSPDFIREVRRLPNGKQIKIVICTSHCSDEERVRARAIGADDVLLKPFDRHHIWAQFEELRS